MSVGPFIETEEVPPRNLERISERAGRPGPALAALMRSLETREAEVFARYGGKYVETGALRASLTEGAASGAVRRLLASEAEFGTEIPYSVFQGTRGVGGHKPPSAIMPRPTVAEAALASRAVADFVLEGVPA